jgi:1-acyl-sn-glycerol-3-phosphate acyltransferase
VSDSAALPGFKRIADLTLRGIAAVSAQFFHDLEVHGTENVPSEGPVILASNHPSYLDPVFIMCRLTRPVSFLAWERLFRLPVLGWLIRQYGAIPVDIDKPGRGSFEAAVKALKDGQAFGIFPEGGRSDFGTMNPVKSGVARLAMISGAPIVPITIAGAHRVWPKDQLLPRPGPVRVEFHEPIRLAAEEVVERRRDREYEREIVERVLRSINQALLPSLRAERREEELLRKADAPWSLWVEGAPFIYSALALVLAPGRAVPALIVTASYAAYLGLDRSVLKRFPFRLGLRNYSPWFVLVAMAYARGLRFDAPLERPFLWAAGLSGAALLAWLQTFRFPDYRMLRPWALGGLYAALWRAVQ